MIDHIHDLNAYTVTAIKNCRHRFFPFLWWYMDRHDLMCHVRSLAWLILVEDQPQTKRELYNAVQRRLYREAKNDGWHRERRGMRYAQRVVAESDLPSVGKSYGTECDLSCYDFNITSCCNNWWRANTRSDREGTEAKGETSCNWSPFCFPAATLNYHGFVMLPIDNITKP